MTPIQIAEAIRTTLDNLENPAMTASERQLRIRFAQALMQTMQRMQQSDIFEQEIANLQERLGQITEES